MLKRIPVDQLRLGMHLHAMCGPWMSHPFWRTRFVLRDPEDLKRLRDSPVAEVWIDASKGLDVAVGVAAEEAESLPADAVESAPAEAVTAADGPAAPAVVEARHLGSPSAAGDEVARASQICRQARDKVLSLHHEVRMGKAIEAEGCAPLVESIIGSVARDPGALLSLVRLKHRDEYTYLHSVAVCTLMVALGRTLRLPEDELRQLGLGGMLHDMGKAKVPLEVLNKPGKLTPEEFTLMRAHPGWGHELLVEGGVTCPILLDVCLHHHEKMDGTGYPHGLAAGQIGLHARLGAICDVYDAITSARPYKEAWDPGEAVRRMAQWKGHFDPQLFQAFVKTVGIYPVGSLVRLQSGRLAVVLGAGQTSLLTPRVKVFFSTKANMPITPEIVDLGAPGCQDKLLGVEAPEKWNFPHLEELWSQDLLPA